MVVGALLILLSPAASGHLIPAPPNPFFPRERVAGKLLSEGRLTPAGLAESQFHKMVLQRTGPLRFFDDYYEDGVLAVLPGDRLAVFIYDHDRSRYVEINPAAHWWMVTVRGLRVLKGGRSHWRWVDSPVRCETLFYQMNNWALNKFAPMIERP